MNDEYQLISVGDKFNLLTGRDYTNTDGCIIEVLDDGSFGFVIYFYHMQKLEKHILKTVPITVNRIKESNMVLHLIRFGNTELIFELSFDPLLYKDERVEKILKSNMINMFSIESSDNTIQTMRYFNMPKQMYLGLNTMWVSGKKIEDFSGRYKRWVDDLDNRYSIVELWNMSTYVGRMGE